MKKHIHTWRLLGTPNRTRIQRRCEECKLEQWAVREWPPTLPASLEHLADTTWTDGEPPPIADYDYGGGIPWAY